MASLAACQPADSFTTISFAGATLVRSNIGGQGGRCVTPGLCAENETASTPHEIFIRDVGQFMGQSIGLRITNETEYRAWRETINGVKREEEGDSDSLLLVSTWGASRGLDLGAVDVVLLYELPRSADEYLHLAGRTGRNGRAGRVVSFLTREEEAQLGVITRQLGVSIRPDAELALKLMEEREGEGESEGEV